MSETTNLIDVQRTVQALLTVQLEQVEAAEDLPSGLGGTRDTEGQPIDSQEDTPMLYARESGNTLDQVVKKLETSVAEHKFGILGVHDLKERMATKGVAFDHECRVFEVCNPVQAKKVLDADMSLANALPCRICVYEQQGRICVSTIRPTFMLSLFHNAKLQRVAQEVEETIVKIIDKACQ